MVLLCYESDTANAMPGSARLVALCAMLCLLRYVLCAMCYAMLCLCEVFSSRFWLKSFRAAIADYYTWRQNRCPAHLGGRSLQVFCMCAISIQQPVKSI